MAREEWELKGRGKWVCSYKKTTLIICFLIIVVALCFLRSLYASLYIYTGNISRNIVVYSPDQLQKMEESIRIRKRNKPAKLIEWVKKLEGDFSREMAVVQFPQHLKQKIIDEILQKLRSLNSNGTDISKDRVQSWRNEKLKEAKSALTNKTSNSAIPHEEAELLVSALESDWAVLSEEIGLWIPVEVLNAEHYDKPEGELELEEEVLPGRSVPSECHAELHTDYGGAAVRWGLTHHKDSAADCCQACLDHARKAKESEKKCNIWVYCPSEFGCHSHDIYEHKYQECWLKFAEKPRLNFKNRYPESYRSSHPSAPVLVPWVAGVVNA